MNHIRSDFFRRCNFPTEAIEAMTAAEAPLYQAADFSALQQRLFQNDDTVWTELHDAAQRLGIHPFTADLLLLVFCVPEANVQYAREGISEEIFWDSMKDIRFKTEETFSVYGVWGVYCGPWLATFLRHSCICLGRLQFELQHSHCGCKIGPHVLHKGDLLINVHIPSFGKLLHEDVLDAYRRAEQYFLPKLPNRQAWIQVETWILYPPTMELLPAGNLRTWAEDFQVVHSCIDPNQDDRYRIFQVPAHVPMEDYPEDNQLQRQLKAWLLAGNRMGIGFGYLLMQDGELVKA